MTKVERGELTLAYGYGVNAFMKGQPRRPYLDSLVMALGTKEISKRNIKIYKAWLDGWDCCNTNSAVAEYTNKTRRAQK